MIFLGRGYLHNQLLSNMPLVAADDLLNRTGAISNQKAAGLIIVIASSFISPFGVSIVYGPIRSTHTALQGFTSASFAGR